MEAYRWLGNDGYQYLIECTKEDAADIMRIFGKRAKAPTLQMEDGTKYSYYILNTTDKVIMPILHLSWVFGGHVDEPLVGEKCSLAVILDGYRFHAGQSY